MATIAGVSLLALAVVLVGTWVARNTQVSHANQEVNSAYAANQSLSQEAASLASVTKVKSEVTSRGALARQGLAGNVDWVGVLGQVATALPPGERLTSATLSDGTGGSGTSSASTSATASSSSSSATSAAGTARQAGTVSFSVTGSAGQDTAAQWLRAMATVPSLTNVSVGASTLAGRIDTFTSTASVTPAADTHRAAQLPGGKS